MVAILTLFAGLFFGLRVVEVEVGPGVARVELRLDGRAVATLVAPAWSAPVDFGPIPMPRQLEAIAFDDAGVRVGSDRRPVNRINPRVQAGFSIRRETDGESASLDFRPVRGRDPERVLLLLGGEPLPSLDLTRIPLPARAPGSTAVLRATLEFADGEIVSAEALVGGAAGLPDGLTPLRVTRDAGWAGDVPGFDGFFEAGSSPLTVLASERGPAEVRVVVTSRARAVIRDPHGVFGMKDSLPQSLMEEHIRSTRGQLGGDAVWRLVDPARPTANPPAREGTEILAGQLGAGSLAIADDDVRGAAALSALALAERAIRCAILIVVAPGEEARGPLSERALDDLTRSLSVPVVVFRLGGGKSPAFPKARVVNGRTAFALALDEEIRRTLDRQRIVWIAGRVDPPAVRVTAKGRAAGVSLRKEP